MTYRDRTTGEYPITLAAIRRRVNIAFGDEPTQAVLDAANVDAVQATEKPEPGPGKVVREGEPEKVGSGWKQTWIVEDAPPEPAPEMITISDRQFFQALASAPYSMITQQEALDAVKTGEIPPIMQAVVDALPVEQQFPVTMILSGGIEYRRDNDLVEIFGASQGMTPAQIDEFWRFAQEL